jgi:hypothetical protein
MDPLTLFLILIWIPLLALALPLFGDVYRLLTRSKRKAAWRARLARLPPPEEALREAGGDEVAAYLLALLPDGDPTEFFRDPELQARFEEVERIVARRRAADAAAVRRPRA